MLIFIISLSLLGGFFFSHGILPVYLQALLFFLIYTHSLLIRKKKKRGGGGGWGVGGVLIRACIQLT